MGDAARHARRAAGRAPGPVEALDGPPVPVEDPGDDPADVTGYVAQRRIEGAANATINRELSALRRMYSLALAAEKIHRAPRITKLQEHNVRQGFFEREQFEAVRRRLPENLKPVVTFAYITGWRMKSEILSLQWRQVDFKAGTVRLEPGTTKNQEGRTFIMTPELRATLEAQRAKTEALQLRAPLVGLILSAEVLGQVSDRNPLDPRDHLPAFDGGPLSLT